MLKEIEIKVKKKKKNSSYNRSKDRIGLPYLKSTPFPILLPYHYCHPKEGC
jgi:hypothetical protein